LLSFDWKLLITFFGGLCCPLTFDLFVLLVFSFFLFIGFVRMFLFTFETLFKFYCLFFNVLLLSFLVALFIILSFKIFVNTFLLFF
jgi:hypothetical protein